MRNTIRLGLFLILWVLILISQFQVYTTFELLYPIYELPVQFIAPFVSEDALNNSVMTSLIDKEWLVLSTVGTGALYGTLFIILCWAVRDRNLGKS
ncbi:MAG: hypothetical protein O3A01_01495 [bacterium]|nr:hypothetical protein [bacterium]